MTTPTGPLDGVARLHRTLKHTRRFSIVMVVAEPGPTRERLIAALLSWSQAGEVAPLRLLRPPPRERLWRVIEASGVDRPAEEGVVLTDLEPYLVGAHVAPELSELNLYRNQLSDVLGGPLVLVVSAEAHVALARALPDFYSWRASVTMIGDEDIAQWRASREKTEVRAALPQRVAIPVSSYVMQPKRWASSARKTEHVYIVAAEYANPDFFTPARVLSVHRPRATGETPSPADLMERASSNALRTLPDPGCVTHLHGITMPDKRFSTSELSRFYGFKPRLKLGERCAMRMETGTSNGGAVVLASAWAQLRGAKEPGTALVLAAQTFEATTATPDFVGEVIDAAERRAGLNMIPMGDLTMDAILHLAASASTVRGGLGDPAKAEDFLARWLEVKLRLAAEYHPSQRRAGHDPIAHDRQGRWLRTAHMAQASIGACAVVLTTDEKVVEHTLRAGEASGGRVVRIVGVGEGDAPVAVGERDEPITFFRSFRQAFSNLRRTTGRNIDHLRAASFGVIHDAFPSIELAALLALGLSPVDIEQRVLSYWSNPYGGLLGMGHAFAASGLVQVAKAYHTMLRPQRFFLSPVKGSHHPEFQNAPGALHAVTLSVGGPMSNAVAMLVESVAVPSTPDPAARAGASGDRPAWDEAVKLPARHDLAPGDHVPFEDKVTWVASLGRAYAAGLGAASAQALDPGTRFGVLEARTTLRLDAILASMLPLFRGADDWSTPAETQWGKSTVSLQELKSALLPLFAAAWTGEGDDEPSRNRALRRRVRDTVESAAHAALQRQGATPERVAREVGALTQHLLVEMGVPMGYALVGEHLASRPIHQMCVLVRGGSPGEAGIGELLEVTRTQPAYATRSAHLAPGLIPPWFGADGATEPRGWAAHTARALDHAHEALRGPDPHGGLVTLYDAACQMIGDVVAVPGQAPPRAYCTLLRELVLNPAEDWDSIRRCVQSLRPAFAAPRWPVTMHCVFDLIDARKVGDLDALRERLDTVNLAIRRAEAWLEGTTALHARLGDVFAVSAQVPGERWAQRWFPALSFARAVYQECLERGVAVRAVLGLGEGTPVASIDGGDSSAVSRMSFAVDSVLERAGSRSFAQWFHGSARAGVLVVLDAGMARDVLDELGGKADDQVTAVFEALWTLIGGEQLVCVDARLNAARVPFGTIPGEGAMPTVHYQLRARPSPDRAEPITTSQVIESPVAAARSLLQDLYNTEPKVRLFAQNSGFERVLPRINMRGAPREVWAELIEVLMNGAVEPYSDMGAIAMLLQRASAEYPANGRIAALLRSLPELPTPRASVPPPKA